ncbi:putative ABC transport system substrate-binding protein [Alteromonadaceae bacterium Bs31]|nr:putative ABC transport system substrate-binding protein [Alteromonadaceae bacterium Bs31]
MLGPMIHRFVSQAIVLMLASGLASPWCFADKTKIAVLYPKVRHPLNQVFLAINEGIQHGGDFRLLEYELEKHTKAADLSQWLAKNKASGVIALGNRGVNTVSVMGDTLTLPVVVGGAVMGLSEQTNHLTGISLVPAPEHLFAQLAELSGKIKKIHVIYTPATHEWLIHRAETYLKKHAIALNAIPASDLRTLALSYRELLQKQQQKTEALWIPYTGRPLDRPLMNQVLETAWKRDLIVFSSNLADVNRGVLFSMYPDNHATGIQLAELLKRKMENLAPAPPLMLSQSLLGALNTRTAEHLGIALSKQDKQHFKLLFPMDK